MLKKILLPTLLALAALTAPASAAPFTIGSGELNWNQINLYNTGAAAATQRTFAGFVADPRSPNVGAANGSVFPDAPATGPVVDGTTAQNTAFTHKFPAKVAGATYDPATKTGSIEFDGTLHFKSNSPVFGNSNFDITVDDPRLDINGTTGSLFASGIRSNKQPYDRTTPLFTLTGITQSQVGGTIRLTGIVPAVAQTAVFGTANQYPVGAGPERDPDTFGGFDLTLRAPAPNVSVTPTTDIPSSGGTLTVSGTGASRDTPGLYVFLVPAATEPTNTTAPATPPGFSRVAPENISATGAFSTTLQVRSPFTSLGGTAYDCVLTACGVRTVAAEFGNDRSQDTFTPVTFRQVYTVPTATPTATATATPYYNPPVVKKPVLSKIKLKRSKVSFKLSKAAKVTGSVKRKGKFKGKKVKRSVSVRGKMGANAKKLKKLPKGKYVVKLKPKGGMAKSKNVRLK